MDVATCAWEAAGRPATARPAPAASGDCARCGRAGALAPTRKVVSANFTAWDHWRDPSGYGLCQVCVWLYRSRWLRAGPLLVRPGLVQPLTLPELGQVLNQQIPPTTAVVVPLRSGRKHVLPAAAWARVQVDDISLHWTAMDTYRLTVMRRLRSLGFGSSHLTSPCPPWTVLSRTQPTAHSGILADWEQLAPWRASPTWLRLASLATTRPATTRRAA